MFEGLFLIVLIFEKEIPRFARNDNAVEEHMGWRSGDSRHLLSFCKVTSANRHFFTPVTT